MNRDFIYENNNIAYDLQYPKTKGGGIKCKNYFLCEAIVPRDWFDMKGNYLCGNCHMMFGTWGDPENGSGICNSPFKNLINCITSFVE